MCNYTNISSDKRNGSLKLLITQNKDRGDYYVGEYLGRLFITLFSFILPIIGMSTFYGFKNGFITYNYPVTYYKLGLTDLKPAINTYEKLINLNIEPKLVRNGFFWCSP